jgi:serine/threonine protein kinase/tetratricopeptide (TPR) repeat protein
MVAAARCPDRLQLVRFLSADLPDDDASGIESHLEACDSCASSIHEISSEDPLMNVLRGGKPRPDECQVNTLAEQFCRILPGLLAPGTTDLDPGPLDPDVTRVRTTQEVFDFLAPAEGPGEIGRLGPYRVTGQIGAGGMGIVFRAEDPLLRRPVALKVMKKSLSAAAEARRRFLREAQAVAALDHDHIVAIYQAGEDRGVLFLAMPLLQGETLSDRLHREERLPLAESLRIAREVAEGLDVAHRRGLVHRDIKPANLWLEGARGRVKILDFGLSRSLEPEADRSQSGQIAGTPHYMSPEQASGGLVTPLCDLFSLGCVLYQMTTGRVPFDGPDALAVLTALAVAKPEPPDRLNPELPPAASALITSLLARDPSSRPKSARAVVEAIEAIECCPMPLPAPRRRLPPIALALLVVLGISGAGAAFGPQVVRILGDKGQLVIETSDPGVLVEVKRGGRLVTIVDTASGRRIDLDAGDYNLELSEGKDGLRLSTRRFALTRGGREVVRVMMERSPSEPPVNETSGIPPVVSAPPDVRREIDGLTARLRHRPDDPAVLQARAEVYTKAGDPDRAIVDWDRAISIEPTGFRFQARGWVRLARRDRDGALADFGEAIRLEPSSAKGFHGRGQVFFERREFALALADFDEAIRLDPTDASVYEDRAHIRQSSADHHGAIADIDYALRLDPGLTTAHAIHGAALTSLGEWGRGRVALDEFIRRVPREPWSYFHRALCRQNLGDLDGAVADFDLAIQLAPEIFRFYGQRGLALALRHDLGRAQADAERALRSEPRNQEFLRLRGWIRAQKGDYGGALADYGLAFEGRPLDATKLADRASAEALAGHHEAAEADFEAALCLDPSSAWILARRALYLHAARGDHKRAIADCDEALRLNPGHAEASLVRGLSSLALDEFRGAIADFNGALDPSQVHAITFLGPISCHYPELYRARSEAHRGLGDLDSAMEDLDATLGLDPDDAEARVRRGRLHASRRDFASAIADFNRAIALGRRDADIYRDRGEARAAVGDKAGAKADRDAFDRLSQPTSK